MLDVLIGDHEAFIGLPDRKGHPHLRAAILIDDPDLVDALRSWYDEFIWEATCECTDIRYPVAGSTLDAIADELHPRNEPPAEPPAEPGPPLP